MWELWLENVYYVDYSFWEVTIITFFTAMSMYYIGRSQMKKKNNKNDEPFTGNYNI